MNYEYYSTNNNQNSKYQIYEMYNRTITRQRQTNKRAAITV